MKILFCRLMLKQAKLCLNRCKTDQNSDLSVARFFLTVQNTADIIFSGFADTAGFAPKSHTIIQNRKSDRFDLKKGTQNEKEKKNCTYRICCSRTCAFWNLCRLLGIFNVDRSHRGRNRNRFVSRICR